MSEREFVTVFRWITGIALIVLILTVCPTLVSAANDVSVIAGIALFIGALIASAATFAGRADQYLKTAYRTIRDAFFT